MGAPLKSCGVSGIHAGIETGTMEMGVSRKLFLALAIVAAATGFAGLAGAAEPLPWQMNFQPAVTPVAEEAHRFHDLLLVIIAAISVFVLALMVYCFVRFNEKANPVPSRTSHNTLVEVLWTVVPVMILVAIAIPSFKLMYYADRIEEAEMTIKAIGRQWYWSYEYPDYGNFTFDALMVPETEVTDPSKRLLATDTHVVVPVDTNIRLLVTGSDVIHAWTIPAFHVKLDAIPGHVNESWFHVTEEGTYYGQCSELCGVGHAYMPIVVEVVSKEAFAEWVAAAQEEYARVDAPAASVAQLESAGN
jgi:cytochrome c oxidase subunit 2